MRCGPKVSCRGGSVMTECYSEPSRKQCSFITLKHYGWWAGAHFINVPPCLYAKETLSNRGVALKRPLIRDGHFALRQGSRGQGSNHSVWGQGDVFGEWFILKECRGERGGSQCHKVGIGGGWSVWENIFKGVGMRGLFTALHSLSQRS